MAVCYAMVDLGTKYEDMYDKTIHKVLLTWEIPGERIEVERDGHKVKLPRAISKHYTYSLHEKSTLRQDLQSWRGRDFTEDELLDFDLKAVLGAPCQLNVIHKKDKAGTLKAKLATIVPAPKGTKLSPENPTVYFCLADLDEPVLPDNVPDWVKEEIQKSNEWDMLTKRAQEQEEPPTGNVVQVGEGGPVDDDDDSCPF